MSIRKALMGGLVLLAAATTIIVGVVGTISIDRSVLREAQRRVNHDLDTIVTLYQQRVDLLADRTQELVGEIEGADAAQLARKLAHAKTDLKLTVLNVCDPDGRPLAGAHSGADIRVPISTDPILRRALAGDRTRGTVLLGPERLQLEGGRALRNSLLVLPGRPAEPGTGQALMRWFAWPVQDAQGRVAAIVYGGKALNHDYAAVDSMRDTVLGSALYEGKPLGTVTVFLEGTRVATNVLGPDGRRAIGTEVSDEVHQEVLHRGQRWGARAWVVDAWYLSGYEPLKDPDGQIIGMLYLGVLEAPYADLRWQLIAQFLVPVGVVLIVAMLATALVVRRITPPLRGLQEGAELVADGDWDSDVPRGRTYSEIDDLADTFRRMRQAIQQRDQALRARNVELGEANEQLTRINNNYMKTLRFVTHELKAPLAKIQMMIDVVVSGLDDTVSGQTRHMLTRAKRNCEELQDMVKNYLDLARAERGELQASKRPINFHDDVVAPVVEMNTAQLQARGIELAVECPADLTVTADPELMRIALGNYLSNAVKYAREGGQAKLEVAASDSEVTAGVWNEGEGFTPEEGAALFGKFSRLENTATRGKRGSGLGLYLCRQIMDLHDGQTAAESEPGQWAKFTLRFPRS